MIHFNSIIISHIKVFQYFTQVNTIRYPKLNLKEKKKSAKLKDQILLIERIDFCTMLSVFDYND